MSSTPFFSPTADSTPYRQEISRLGVIDVQAAIDKLAWLISINDLLDEDGNFVIKLGPPVPQIVLASDMGAAYLLSASNEGELVTDSSSIPPVPAQNYRTYKKPDGTFARLTIAEDGVIAVIDAEPDPYAPPSGKLFFRSPNNTLWLFSINNDNEIVLESGQAFNNWFKVINQANQLLFGVNTQGFLGLSYLPVFTKINLPPTPNSEANTLPWAFLMENSGEKVPVYFDGTVWRYFSNNGAV